VLHTDAGYTLYYTARRHGTNRQCIGRAFSTTPAGPYVDDHDEPLVCQLGLGGSIDASPYWVGGTPYLTWKADTNALYPPGSRGPYPPTTIWSAPLSPDGQDIGAARMLFYGGFGWADPLVEGPDMVQQSGHWYLFYSGGRWDRSSYAIGWASCAGPVGPCSDATRAHPWKASSASGWGPGGASFFTDGDGNLWMAYHAWTPQRVGYRYTAAGGNRSLHLEMVTFQNGKPIASAPARDVAANPHGGYYVLDATGRIRAYDGAPWYGDLAFPGDLARAIAVMPDGHGYVVVDAWGGVHRFGSASDMPVLSIYWRGHDLARDLAITPSGDGYALLDAWGGIHVSGDAARPATYPYWRGFDIARSIAMTPTRQGYLVLDGWGGVHPVGDAPRLGGPYFRGLDVARSIAMSRTGNGYSVLDGWGGVHTYGDVPSLVAPGGWSMTDRWVAATLASDGTWVAVRRDGVNAVWSSSWHAAPTLH
jgi:hypothetical protein